MTSSSKRTLLGIFSLISFFLSTFFLYRLPFHQDILSSSSSFYLTFAGLLIFSYNVAIIFAWLGFGQPVGVIITVLSIIFALVLVSQGVVQNFKPYVTVKTVEGADQIIPLGPAASPPMPIALSNTWYRPSTAPAT